MDIENLRLRIQNYCRSNPMSQLDLSRLIGISEHTLIRMMKHHKGCYHVNYYKIDKFLADWESQKA